MEFKGKGVAAFAVVLVIFLSGWIIGEVDGAVWVTTDSKGRKAVFDLPKDHPAIKATGKEAKLWAKTEFLKEEE